LQTQNRVTKSTEFGWRENEWVASDLSLKDQIKIEDKAKGKIIQGAAN
jgi:hypothetical protein